MANSPSKMWKDGVLMERAIATDAPAEANVSEGTTAKPYKNPVPTPRTPEEREELRRRLEAEAASNVKMVDGDDGGPAENKAVKAKATKKK